jgi:cobalt-precorrin-6B (C15)-methyltransferase
MIYPGGTPTQPEIIAVALLKLNVRKSDIFVDIGCGSGSVSIQAAKLAKKVYAIDDRNEAIHATRENLKECGVANVFVLKGEASLLLADIDIDCAFIGGSKNIEQVLKIVMKKVTRFAVSAVRIETAAQAMEIMKKNNRFNELLQIQLSRGSELGDGTMLKPENPVFLIIGGEKC